MSITKRIQLVNLILLHETSRVRLAFTSSSRFDTKFQSFHGMDNVQQEIYVLFRRDPRARTIMRDRLCLVVGSDGGLSAGYNMAVAGLASAWAMARLSPI